VDERHLFEDHAGSGRGDRCGPAPRPSRPPLLGNQRREAHAVIAALDGGAAKAAVCRSFGTLIDSRARIGWSTGLDVEGV
jgi:hypothetical protein